MPIDITEVKRVIEMGLHDQRYGMSVQDYLDEGWILLNVHSVSTNSDYGNSQRAVYSLGWPYEEDPPGEVAFSKATSATRRAIERIRERNKEPHQEEQDC